MVRCAGGSSDRSSIIVSERLKRVAAQCGWLVGLGQLAYESIPSQLEPSARVRRSPPRRQLRYNTRPRTRRRIQPARNTGLVAPSAADWLSSNRLLVAPGGNRTAGYLLAKRSIDLVGAILMLLLLGPAMAAVWAVLMITTRGKPIFVQERVGHCGRRFRMYKFRTMVLNAAARQDEVTNEHDGPIFKNRRDPRITLFGRFLRSTSLDETPQLFNIIAGHMSLVGPRPPVPREVLEYAAWQRRRLAVKPGLTCLWQVSGRSEIGFQQWMRMDLWYVRHQSLRTDLMLLAKTPASVLSRRGAY